MVAGATADYACSGLGVPTLKSEGCAGIAAARGSTGITQTKHLIGLSDQERRLSCYSIPKMSTIY